MFAQGPGSNCALTLASIQHSDATQRGKKSIGLECVTVALRMDDADSIPIILYSTLDPPRSDF